MTHGRRQGDALFRPQPLPARVESEVPREAELDALQSLLRDARLLTVLGPGGIGKTALALELARRCAEVFVDGVWLVDLTPCRNEAEVGDLLLTTFGLARQQASGNSDWSPPCSRATCCCCWTTANAWRRPAPASPRCCCNVARGCASWRPARCGWEWKASRTTGCRR